jgi:hypothetical protein
MDKEDKQLLENVFDSLDRLFDRQNCVIDLYHLILATHKAIREKTVNLSLASYADKLGQIVRENDTEEVQREKALIATDQLREILNETL